MKSRIKGRLPRWWLMIILAVWVLALVSILSGMEPQARLLAIVVYFLLMAFWLSKFVSYVKER